MKTIRFLIIVLFCSLVTKINAFEAPLLPRETPLLTLTSQLEALSIGDQNMLKDEALCALVVSRTKSCLGMKRYLRKLVSGRGTIQLSSVFFPGRAVRKALKKRKYYITFLNKKLEALEIEPFESSDSLLSVITVIGKYIIENPRITSATLSGDESPVLDIRSSRATVFSSVITRDEADSLRKPPGGEILPHLVAILERNKSCIHRIYNGFDTITVSSRFGAYNR